MLRFLGVFLTMLFILSQRPAHYALKASQKPQTAFDLEGPFSLTDQNGWSWTFHAGGGEDYAGSLIDGFNEAEGFGSAFDAYAKFQIDQSRYTGDGTYMLEDGGREAVFPSQEILGLNVQRKIFVPSNASFARFTQILNNTTASTVVFNFYTGGDMGMDASAHYQSELGNFTDQFGERWFLCGGQDENNPCLLFLFDGSGEHELQGNAEYAFGSANSEVDWDVSLAAGQTKTVVYFLAMRGSFSELRDLAEELHSHPEIAFQSMSAEEKNSVGNWNLSDAEGDGMPDAWEEEHELNPSLNDSAQDADGDGLNNIQEFNLGTNPNNADSDGDNLNDGDEVEAGGGLLDPDSDDDGLADGIEADQSESGTGTDPLNADSDGDLIPDALEVENESDPNAFTDYSASYDMFCSPNGDDDTGNGSQANPFFSIGRAVQEYPDFAPEAIARDGGDIFRVFLAPGVYELSETSTFGNLDGLCLRGSGKRLSILDGASAWNGLHMENTTNVEIQDLAFRYCPVALEALGSLDGLNLHDIHVHCGQGGRAFDIQPTDTEGTYSFSFIQMEYGMDAFLFDLMGNSNHETDDPQIIVNGLEARGFTNRAFSFKGVEEDGDFAGNFSATALHAENCREPFLAEHFKELNLLHSTFEGFGSSSQIQNCGSAEFENNVFVHGSNGHGLHIATIENGSSFRNCTFADVRGNGLEIQTASVEDHILRNCLFCYTGQGNDPIGGFGIQFVGSQSNLNEDYNAFFQNTGASINVQIPADSLNPADHDIVGENPKLNGAGSGDYSPQADSPLRNAGDNLDGIAGNRDDNIGANNSSFVSGGGSIAPPGEGEPGENVTIGVNDPESPQNGVSVLINTGNLASGGSVIISGISDFEVQNILDIATLVYGGNMVDISLSAGFVPDSTVEITLPVPVELDINDVSIYHFNSTQGRWNRLTTIRLDLLLRKITALHNTDDGFSPFVVGLTDQPSEGGGGGGSNSSGSSGSGKLTGASCFIATASYEDFGKHIEVNETGSYFLSWESKQRLDVLREFRAKRLMTNPLGRCFVNFYNFVGPVAARFIRDKSPIKSIIRPCILAPLSVLAELSLGRWPSAQNGMLVLLIYVLAGIWVYRKRSVIIKAIS